MVTRALAACLILSGLGAPVFGQPASVAENWTPVSRNAQSATGRVSFTQTSITLQNGKSLPLAPGGQMLFRPEPKKRKVMADLYRITAPDDAVPLCRGKPATYLIVWKSEPVEKATDPRTVAPFSGPKLNAGSTDDCGRYIYDAGAH